MKTTHINFYKYLLILGNVIIFTNIYKEKLPLDLGEPAIADAQVLTSRLKVPSLPN
jgi:hypothetical protein